jgi:hypothetical protein
MYFYLNNMSKNTVIIDKDFLENLLLSMRHAVIFLDSNNKMPTASFEDFEDNIDTLLKLIAFKTD